MSSFNKITIVGYLGRDPELRHTPNGNTVCNLSVATTEKRNNEDVTTWFRVTVWGKQAELCNEWLAKGRQVYIEGRLSLQSYTDREGQNRSSLEVNATDIKFLGDRGANGGGQKAEAPADKQARREALKTPREVAEEVERDDEIPF